MNTYLERVPDALRGRGTGDVDLVPWMCAGLVLALVGGPALGYLSQRSAGGAVEGFGLGLIFYLLAVASLVSARMEAYGGADEDPADDVRPR